MFLNSASGFWGLGFRDVGFGVVRFRSPDDSSCLSCRELQPGVGFGICCLGLGIVLTCPSARLQKLSLTHPLLQPFVHTLKALGDPEKEDTQAMVLRGWRRPSGAIKPETGRSD